MTNHRTIALDALRRLPPEVRLDESLPSSPLPGAELPPDSKVLQVAEPDTALHLLSLYGGEAARVLDYADSVPRALDPIHPGGPDVWAQAHFAVDNEWAMTVDDISWRRTTLGMRGLATDELRTELSGLLADRRAVHTPLAASGLLRWP